MNEKELLEQKKARRFKYLKALYDASNADPMARIDMHSLGANLGLNSAEVDAIARYLHDEGLLKFVAMGGIIAITHRGVIEIEESIEAPSKPTEHFPAFNVINVGSMHNSQITQGAFGSSQSNHISSPDLQSLKDFLETASGIVSKLELGEDAEREIKADLATLHAQVDSTKPKTGIIHECLSSVRRILEGAAGKAAADALLPPVIALISTFGSAT